MFVASPTAAPVVQPKDIRTVVLIGVAILLAGAIKLTAAVVFSAAMMKSDRDGGLFGFQFGGLFLVVLGIPGGIAGAFDLLAGLGTVLRRKWGYVLGLLSGALGAIVYAVPVVFCLYSAARSFVGASEASAFGPLPAALLFATGVAANGLIVGGLRRCRAAFGP
jgi:hypothetical protein